MRRSISPLTAVLTVSLAVAGLAIMLSATGLVSGAFAVWMTLLSFFGLILVITWRTAMHYPTKLTFLYLLVLVTAGSWVSYTVITLGLTDLDATYANTGAILMTLFQNIMGFLVAVLVFERMNRSNQARGISDWLPDLLGRVRALPWFIVWAVLGVHLALVAYSASLGQMMSGTGGIMTEVSMLQSIILQLSDSISGTVTLLGFMLLIGGNQRRRCFSMGLLALQLVLAFLGGRRGLFGVVLLGGLLWTIARGLNFKRLIVMAGIMITVVTVAWPAFLLLRGTAQQEGINAAAARDRTAILAQSADSTFKDFSPERAYSQEYVENLKNRFGFFGWTVMIQEKLMDGWEMRGGEIVLVTFLEMVPRFLWPGKLDYLGHRQVEQKIQMWFGMPDEDSASTFLGYSIADGGWIGVILYFAFFGAALGLLMRFVSTGYFTLTRLWAAGVVFSLCYNIEAGFGEVIGTLRLFIAVLLLEWLWRRMRHPKPLLGSRSLAPANRPPYQEI